MTPSAAAARGELARQRAADLQRRREELAAGIAVSPENAGTARRRADESRERAERAHRDAAERHLEAVEAHLKAAAAHEQAALLAGNGDGEAHLDAAEGHRAEAQLHRLAAAEQSRAEQADHDRASISNSAPFTPPSAGA